MPRRKTKQARIEELEAELAKLNELREAFGKLVANSDAISDIESRLDCLETADIDGRLADLENEIETVATNLSDLESKVEDSGES